MANRHDCPYKDGPGWMIHEVSSVLSYWDYLKKHKKLTEEVLDRGVARLKAAEDFGRTNYREPRDENRT